MKQVRFGESKVVCIVASRSRLTIKEKNRTWWSRQDLIEFLSASSNLGQCAQESTFMVAGFELAYAMARRLAQTPENLQDVTVHVNPGLLDWCRFGHSWRGLELSSSLKHRRDRFEDARRARYCVFQMKSHKAVEAYRQMSRVSAVFARIMGESDAMVSRGTIFGIRQSL